MADKKTREERRRELEAILEARCPRSSHGSHGDPDDSGLCIYCGCWGDIETALEIEEETGVIVPS